MLRKIKDFLKKNRRLKGFSDELNRKYFGQLKDNSYLYFQYPWKIDFKERKNALISNKMAGKKTIVYIYPFADAATFRFRAYNVCEVINADLSDKYYATFFFENEIRDLKSYADQIDSIIFVRVGWRQDAISLVEELKSRKVKVGYDFDDLVFNIDEVPKLITQIAAESSAGYYFYYVASCYSLAKFADYFVTTNNFLAEKLTDFFKRKVLVIPNFLNKEEFEFAKTIDVRVKPNQNKFIMGYFSGTKTHDKDFQLIASDLIKFMREYENVYLKVVGHLELPKEFSEFSSRVIRKGLKNYLDLLIEIKECNLNLIPLHINDFTNCKSEIKFFNAGIVKVPSIASATYVYKKCVEHEVNGLLSLKNDNWYDLLKKACSNHEKLKLMGESAYQTSIESYFGNKIKNTISQFLKNIV